MICRYNHLGNCRDEKDDNCWLVFYGFGALSDHHQIIDSILGTYVGIPVLYGILGVEELLQNGGRSANTIVELFWHE